MKNPISLLINLLFPPLCLHCNDRLTNRDKFLCEECRSALQFLQPVCDFCGSYKPVHPCPDCSSSDFTFDKARSVFPFNPSLQSLIHHLKYSEMTKTAEFLAQSAAEYLHKHQPFEQIDIIAPVPLHAVKKRSRGFNQSELLTRKLAELMNCRHVPNLIIRKRFTDTQTRLNRAQRQNNVADAFRLNPRYNVKNKNILLVDDVFTTGATINSMSKILKNNEVSKIYVLTIARA